MMVVPKDTGTEGLSLSPNITPLRDLRIQRLKIMVLYKTNGVIITPQNVLAHHIGERSPAQWDPELRLQRNSGTLCQQGIKY